MAAKQKVAVGDGRGQDGGAGELCSWANEAAANDGNLSYPFIRIYWVEKDGTVRADYRFSGYPYRADAETLIAQIERFVAGFQPRTGGLRVHGFSGDGARTVSAPLPLARVYGASGPLTNTLSFARTLEGGGTTNWSETLIWGDGETNRNIFVENTGYWSAGRSP